MMKSIFLLITIALLFYSNDAFTNTKTERIDSLNTLAYKIRHDRDLPRMKALANSALELSQNIRYKEGEGWAYLNIGIAHLTAGTRDTALFELQKAMLLFKSENVKKGIALTLGYTGYIYQGLNNYDKAEKLFIEEIESFRELEDHFETANSLVNLGTNYLIQTKYPEALQYYIEALNIRKIHKLDPSKEYHNIAIIYAKMHEYDKSLKYLHEAIELGIQRQDTSGLIKTYNSIGNNYYRRSPINYDSVTFYIEKSLSLAEKSGYAKSQVIALGNLAEIYMDKLDYEKSKRYINKALTLQGTISKTRHFFSILTLARIYQSEGKLDSSLLYAKQVFDRSNQLGGKTLQKNSSEFISKIFEEKAMYDSAFHYYRQYKSVNDSIYNTEKAKMFSNLQIQLETLEKENEIQLLTTEKALAKYINYGLGVIIILIIGIAFFIYKTINERNKRKNTQLEIEKQILEQKVEHNKKELFNFTLNMINKNNSLMDVEEEVKNALSKDRSEINPSRILSKISIGKSSEKDWENFNKYFGAVHNDFFTKIKNSYPALTSYELRLCALIRLHLSNREIAEILSIEQKSVKMACYRLKKKFELDQAQKLSDFVSVQ